MSAEDIVRALAEADPISESGTWHWCGLCVARLPIDITDHASDCPWRLAVEWVAAQETPAGLT